MDPIKINIEVSLSETTLAALRSIAEALKGSTKEAAKEEPKAEPVQVTTPTVEAAPEAQDEPVADDVPDFGPAAADISDDELAEVMVETKKRLVSEGKPTAAIKTKVFKKYNIGCSVDCPKDMRAALINDLRAL